MSIQHILANHLVDYFNENLSGSGFDSSWMVCEFSSNGHKAPVGVMKPVTRGE
jgi:hypothetical protein